MATTSKTEYNSTDDVVKRYLTMHKLNYCKYIIMGLSLLLASSCIDDLQDCRYPGGPGKMSLSFTSDPMSRYAVRTRGENKTEDEIRINRLYIFFFGPDGKYLEGSYLAGYSEEWAAGYYALGEGVKYLNIANNPDNFTDTGAAGGEGTAMYEVVYTLYLGADHTDDFTVRRNHRYDVSITITGPQRHNSASPETFNFDARINMKDQDYNRYHLSILRELRHDAHFCVTPMDVYFFNNKE